jgi:hypothetical protein
MGLISPSQSADGQSVVAAKINDPINTIANEFNGNIDNANIKAAAGISGTKLADSTVSTVKLTNPYKFSVYRNSGWTDGNNAFVKIQFDTKNFDTGSNYDNTTNYRFTAPVNGFYFFSARSGSSITTGNFGIIQIFKNGVGALTGNQLLPNGTGDQGRVVSGLLQLVATDYVEVFSYGTGGVGDVGTSVNYFHGFLVSST